jgi:hypothetical protein
MKKTTLALLISILAFFLRITVAYNGPIEHDEQIYFTAAAKYNLAMRQDDWTKIIDSTFNIEHPQFYKLVYAVGLMAGKSTPDRVSFVYGQNIQSVSYWHKIFILRMISVFLGTAAVFLISLINPLGGLFLAINTYAIKYTSVIYLEALPALTSLVALLAALKSLKAYQNSATNWKKWGVWLGLSSLALGMSAASKYIYSLVGIVIIISIIIQGRKNILPSLLGLAGWGLLAAASFFILDPMLWHSPVSTMIRSVNFNFNYSVGRHVLEVGYPFWQPIKWLMISIPQQPNIPFTNKGDFFISADSIIFILAVVGLPTLLLRKKPMFIWLVAGMAFLLVWGSKWPQYILLIMAPYCISAAYGFDLIHSVLFKMKTKNEEG